MNGSRVDHTAIVVRDMDEALGRYRVLLTAECTERVHVENQGVEVAFLRLGDTQIELVQPTCRESGIARFLEERGEGLHHVGIRVTDIRVELERLRANGIKLIDEVPRRGVHGLIAFIHPRGTGGTLIELVMHDESDGSPTRVAVETA